MCILALTRSTRSGRCTSYIFYPYQAPTYALIDHPPATTVIDVVCQPLPRSVIVTSHRRHIRSSGPDRVEEALQGYFSPRRLAPASLSHYSLLDCSSNR